jgi:hypothetical protein
LDEFNEKLDTLIEAVTVEEIVNWIDWKIINGLLKNIEYKLFTWKQQDIKIPHELTALHHTKSMNQTMWQYIVQEVLVTCLSLVFKRTYGPFRNFTYEVILLHVLKILK